MTKPAFQALKNEVRALAMQIGLRPAARAMGINEDRVRKWSSVDKWLIGAIHPPGFVARPSPEITAAHEVTRRLLEQHSTRTKLGFAIAATNASETLAETPHAALLKPATAIAADQWAKVSNVVHGWTQERAQGVTVNVANVTLPSEADRAERREMHNRLDAIAARLAKTPDL